MIQDAVIRNIEIIGEASKNVLRCDPVFAEKHNEIPWEVIYAMRNRISHSYHKVDLEIVWNLVQNELPILHSQMRLLLDGLSN